MPHTQESVQNLCPHDAIYRADSKASKNCRDNCMVEITNVADQVGSFPIRAADEDFQHAAILRLKTTFDDT